MRIAAKKDPALVLDARAAGVDGGCVKFRVRLGGTVIGGGVKMLVLDVRATGVDARRVHWSRSFRRAAFTGISFITPYTREKRMTRAVFATRSCKARKTC